MRIFADNKRINKDNDSSDRTINLKTDNEAIFENRTLYDMGIICYASVCPTEHYAGRCHQHRSAKFIVCSA